MDFDLNQEQRQVKESVREFAEGEIAPHASGTRSSTSPWSFCRSWPSWG
jgi:alkylation response protein AidB-like acyl-CoA dehydrogenase